MKYFRLVFLAVSIVLIASGCDHSVNKQGGLNGRILPNITGGAGEVLVIMDNFNWDNDAGEAMRDLLMKAVPALPQSEPTFDITHGTAASFDGFFKFHRSIILTTINASVSEPSIRYRENAWARPQIVVEMQAASSQQLIQLIRDNQETVYNFLLQYDRKRLMNMYEESRDTELQERIQKDHQVHTIIPRGYNLDFSNKEYTSLSIETPDFSQVIQIFDYPVNGPEALQTEALLQKRDEFTSKYVKGPDDKSYMVIAKLFPPQVYDLKIDNREVVEIRGLWELEGGYMGGPFVSHAVYDAARKRVVFIDGYVYYPNERKRTKMRQVEAVVYSLKLI